MLIPNLDWESKSDRKEFDDILQKYSFDSFHSAKYAIEAQSFYEDLSLRGDAAIVEYLRKYSHSEYTEDTICAICTPPGIGSISVIRLSGSMSENIANKIFKSRLIQNVELFLVCIFK